jgi:hypothetical protein
MYYLQVYRSESDSWEEVGATTDLQFSVTTDLITGNTYTYRV